MTLSFQSACMPNQAVTNHPCAHNNAALGRVVTHVKQSILSCSVMLVLIPVASPGVRYLRLAVI